MCSLESWLLCSVFTCWLPSKKKRTNKMKILLVCYTVAKCTCTWQGRPACKRKSIAVKVNLSHTIPFPSTVSTTSWWCRCTTVGYKLYTDSSLPQDSNFWSTGTSTLGWDRRSQVRSSCSVAWLSPETLNLVTRVRITAGADIFPARTSSDPNLHPQRTGGSDAIRGGFFRRLNTWRRGWGSSAKRSAHSHSDFRFVIKH